MRAVALLALFPAIAAADTVPPTRPPPAPDLAALDRAVEPCVDFYRFACGGWMKAHPLPPDKSRHGRFDELAERNLVLLRSLLEDAARHPEAGPVQQKTGGLYQSCMDEAAVDARGVRPVLPDLKRIAAIKTRAELMDEVTRLHRIGTPVLFQFGSMPDFHDARQMIARIDQGGLSLPDRDYYLKDDGRSVETRGKFLEHVARMLTLAGRPDRDAAAEARAVLRIETILARASMDRTLRREPHNLDHPTATADLASLAGPLDLPRYFAAVGAPSFGRLNVDVPEFFKQVSSALSRVPLADWRTYLGWRRLARAAPLLSAAFVEQDFRFGAQYLNGQKEIAPRWKRCTRLVDEQLGEALGRLYVDKHFGGEAKARTLALVKTIEEAMARDLGAIDWMGEATKTQARRKLAALANNIGYPDRWRDYGPVTIAGDDLLGNVDRATAFEAARRRQRIGRPSDRKEWEMSPPTVNAYYRGSFDDMNFPAGILQPPFFDATGDPAANLGGIGAVIGHELTHGFDDKGRKFNAQGNLEDWWTEKDAQEFEKRAACIDDEYAGFVPVKDDKGEVHLNGKLTLGENTADNGGVRLAFMALEATLPPEARARKVDGYTAAQRLFLGFAQIWCQNSTPQSERVRALTDPHSPGRFRTNGTLSNMPEFQRAFACQPGQPMVRSNACRVW